MKRVLHKSQFGRRIVSYAVAVITIFSVSQYSIYALTNETEPEYYELYVSPDGTGSGDGTLKILFQLSLKPVMQFG